MLLLHSGSRFELPTRNSEEPEKVTISSERRKLLRIVGVFGKDEKQLKEESGLNKFFFKFHMDFLLKEGFLKFEDGMYCLTDT